ncbi:unnamed protein product, partial [Mesorhabditis belari]|uniref:Enoyl reductase (ER) domain-containing protein n=1 Tax=Mesorhabditis belari TaxID=2138241 RepID=A0AAF3FJD6_9BILA
MVSDTEGKSITCRAALLWGPNDLRVNQIDVAAPKEGEVRVRILYNSLCHTDLHFIDGSHTAPYPAVLGHEGAGVVESVGDGVTRFKPGDAVVPTFMPQCKNCSKCARGDTNFCEKINFENFFGDMADGTSRFSLNGEKVYHFMGTSCFSEYTVIKEIMLAKIDPEAPMDKACLFGCGFPTGYGAAVNTAEVKQGERVAVIGAGAIGLSAIYGAHQSGAKEIYAIDINPDKEEIARKMGATHFVNPKDAPEGTPFIVWFIKTFGTVDKAIECIGHIECMVNAIYMTTRGWGRTVIVGVGAPGKDIAFNPAIFLERKTILGCCFGDYHGVDDIPVLVNKLKNGEINVDPLITHHFDLEQVNEAVTLLKQGKAIRSVMAVAKKE